MYPFRYQRPATLAEAVHCLATDEASRLLAGGQTLIPVMRQRLASPGRLVDIARLSELRGERLEQGRISLGAATTHAEAAASALLHQHCPGLAALAGQIADPAVRSLGTLGGSLANADPAADWAAGALALDAVVETTRGQHPIDTFFIGLFETALARDEVLCRVSFAGARRACYLKMPSPASRYAMVGVCAAELDDGIRVAVTGAAARPFRWLAAEAALGQSFSVRALEGLSLSPEGLNADLHASPAYRAQLTAVLTRRAVTVLAQDEGLRRNG